MLTAFPSEPDTELVEAVEAAFNKLSDLVDVPDAWMLFPDRKKHRPSGCGRKWRRKMLIERDGNACIYCQTPFSEGNKPTLEHIVPHRLLPKWDLWNLALACEPCNQAKDSQIHAVVLPFLMILLATQVRLMSLPAVTS